MNSDTNKIFLTSEDSKDLDIEMIKIKLLQEIRDLLKK